jgi:RNA polymerase sigma-70 factor (ECF subfamily)
MQSEVRSELRHTLRVLDGLPEPDRVALMLRARDGLSYEEIATVLGISVAAAKVRIHHARVRLMNVRTLAEETS